MKPFLPKRFEMMAFSLMLSGMMSFIVSGLATALSIGMPSDFVFHWVKAWLPSWGIAFPAVLIVAPLVRRILSKIIIVP
ncbi:DUF2798 domain-containing protein [Pararhizobium sp.]|uniref:DUF2798 domain-containing protein n=1 Tax=Pararhizobium sp. TaxID=1977563 RepID=UPI00271F1F95|nr:DUF2798 domain-containing protein [Pararhizobium sp.]MDO9416612.1 DUF2798 domain-containing protein [Pararhizobium sp.]